MKPIFEEAHSLAYTSACKKMKSVHDIAHILAAVIVKVVARIFSWISPKSPLSNDMIAMSAVRTKKQMKTLSDNFLIPV